MKNKILQKIICAVLCCSLTVVIPAASVSTSADVGQEDITIPTLSSVNAAAYCVYDKTTGEIILSSNPDDKIYPASMTKIMTAQLALEYLDTDAYLTVSQNAIDATTSDSTLMGLAVGETVKVSELLYGLLLPSGNDAANVLAEGTIEALFEQYPASSDSVGPDGINASYFTEQLDVSEEEVLDNYRLTAFALLMNLRAENLGCTGTHFTNANGLHDDDHYTTASDLTIMMSAAVENPDFVTVINTPTHVFEATNVHTSDAWSIVKTTDYLLNDPWLAATTAEGEDSHLSAVIGGKTGTTSDAGTGMTLYVVCENGHELMISVCGIPYDQVSWQTRYVASVTAYGSLACWQNDPQSVIPGTTGDYRPANSTDEEAPEYDPLQSPGDSTEMTADASDDSQEQGQTDETQQDADNPTGDTSSEETESGNAAEETDKKSSAVVLFAEAHPAVFIIAAVLLLLIIGFSACLIIRLVNKRKNRRKRKMRPYRGGGDYIK